MGDVVLAKIAKELRNIQRLSGNNCRPVTIEEYNRLVDALDKIGKLIKDSSGD